jgi:integrase
VDELEAVRAAIRAWAVPAKPRSGPRHTGDLADIIDLMLATGMRIGEALAVLWEDVDTAGERPTLTVSGTIVYVKGKGFYRQPWTKSDAGYRTIILPGFAVAMLERRREQKNDLGALFVSRTGTWLSPHNVRRQWRAAREDTGLEWVVPHTFRKTVATIIDREADAEAAAAQLGHKDKDVTKTQYIQKPKLAPDVSAVLDALGPGEARSA